MTDTPREHPLGQGPDIKAAKPASLDISSKPATPVDLERRVAALEAKPKPIPPRRRKPLPWPRAAVAIAWIACFTFVLVALIGLVAVTLVVNTVPGLIP